MGCPVGHDLLSETCFALAWCWCYLLLPTNLHCSKEVEGRKEKGDHVSSLGCVRSLCGRISDDAWRYLYAVIILKEARMRVPKGNQIGRSP